MATGNVYGKTNVPVKIINNEYTGAETETTNTIVDNTNKTIAVEVKQELLDKIDALETQVSVYNYFSSLWDEDSYPTVFLPLQETEYLIRSICAKWVPGEGDEGGIELYIRDPQSPDTDKHNTLILGDGTYMLYSHNHCPICNYHLN